MKKHTKLKARELIEHLETNKGVKFTIISKSNAIKFIERNNYYYKVAAFRKNFSKNSDNKYIHLEFAHLIDLSTIDMHIREVLLNISVNVEHFIKTELSRLLNNNAKEDGYSIVKEFETQYPDYFQFTINKFKSSRYQKDMYIKRKNDIPYWVLLEHMDYGCLLKFVRLYYLKYKPASLKKAVDLGDNARHIRNACAHNNVFIINIFSDDNKLKNVTSAVTTVAQNLDILKHKNYKKINDILSLFILSKAYCSQPVIEYQKKELLSFLTRCKRNKDYYSNNDKILESYTIFSKIVDFL